MIHERSSIPRWSATQFDRSPCSGWPWREGASEEGSTNAARADATRLRAQAESDQVASVMLIAEADRLERPAQQSRDAAVANPSHGLEGAGLSASDQLLADIHRTNQYARDLRAAGLEVETKPLDWRDWCSGPWVATTSLTATKPPHR